MKRRTFLAAVTFGGLAAYGRAEGALPGGAKAAPLHGDRQAVITGVLDYARGESGKPYLWGGTGPDAFDCSGLVMMAYRAAGITIPRTSQQQWAVGPRVSDPQPGDLVFFPGVDGTRAQPGHVGLVTAPGRMIQAYALGFPVGLYPFGTSDALQGTGPGDVVGFTRPTE